jgi:hypothetical protein
MLCARCEPRGDIASSWWTDEKTRPSLPSGEECVLAVPAGHLPDGFGKDSILVEVGHVSKPEEASAALDLAPSFDAGQAVTVAIDGSYGEEDAEAGCPMALRVRAGEVPLTVGAYLRLERLLLDGGSIQLQSKGHRFGFPGQPKVAIGDDGQPLSVALGIGHVILHFLAAQGALVDPVQRKTATLGQHYSTDAEVVGGKSMLEEIELAFVVARAPIGASDIGLQLVGDKSGALAGQTVDRPGSRSQYDLCRYGWSFAAPQGTPRLLAAPSE